MLDGATSIKNKLDIHAKIDQIHSEISNISPSNDNQLTDLLHKLDSLEAELNKIVEQETAGLIVGFRIKWAEHGEEVPVFLQSGKKVQ